MKTASFEEQLNTAVEKYFRLEDWQGYLKEINNKEMEIKFKKRVGLEK